MREQEYPSGEGTVHSDSETETFNSSFDSKDDRAPVESVVETVAVATGREETELRPIYEVIDPDALDGLFPSTLGDEDLPTNGRVTFRYEGCTVTVHERGRTVVSLLQDHRE